MDEHYQSLLLESNCVTFLYNCRKFFDALNMVTHFAHLQNGPILCSFPQIHLLIEPFLRGATYSMTIPWNIF